MLNVRSFRRRERQQQQKTRELMRRRETLGYILSSNRVGANGQTEWIIVDLWWFKLPLSFLKGCCVDDKISQNITW